jgi:hypothetical protein
MKHLFIAGMFAVTTSAAIAQPFEFQERVGSTEYNFYEDTRNMTFAPVVRSGKPSSLTAWMQGANVDGIALNRFEGTIIESGPSRISLYEFVRDSPEGIAYRGYHERYPVDTDWKAVARDYRKGMNDGLASGAKPRAGDS